MELMKVVNETWTGALIFASGWVVAHSSLSDPAVIRIADYVFGGLTIFTTVLASYMTYVRLKHNKASVLEHQFSPNFSWLILLLLSLLPVYILYLAMFAN